MNNPYLVNAPLELSFEEVSEEREREFNLEFENLSEADADPIGHWLKLKKAKGETEDADEVLLELIVNLHRKIDRLENIIKGEFEELLQLRNKILIEEISFSNFKIEKKELTPNTLYYGRVKMKSYPQRDVPLFFKALSEDLVEIVKIHSRDENDWGAYFRARERIMIREQRR